MLELSGNDVWSYYNCISDIKNLRDIEDIF